MWGFTSKNKKALCDKRLVTPGWHVQQCMGRHWMWSAATVRSLLPMLLAHSLEPYLQLLSGINNRTHVNLKSSHFLLRVPSLIFLKVLLQCNGGHSFLLWVLPIWLDYMLHVMILTSWILGHSIHAISELEFTNNQDSIEGMCECPLIKRERWFICKYS